MDLIDSIFDSFIDEYQVTDLKSVEDSPTLLCDTEINNNVEEKYKTWE